MDSTTNHQHGSAPRPWRFRDVPALLIEETATVSERFAACPDRLFQLICGYVVFLASIQFLTLGLSVLQVRISQAMAIGILVVALLAGRAQSRLMKPPPLEPRPWNEARTPGRKTTAILVLIALGFYALFWLRAYLKPDMTWDGNAYHIPPINFWAIKGYVHWVEPDLGLSNHGLERWIDGLRGQIPRFWNGFPFGVEVCAFILVKAFGTGNMLNTVNLVYMPLGVFSIIYLARVLGVRRSLACLPGAAYIMLPVNVQQASSIMIDAGVAACVLAFLAILTQIMRRFRGAQIPWKTAVPLGGSIGLMIGSKLTGVVNTVMGLSILAIYIMVALWVMRRRGTPVPPGAVAPPSKRRLLFSMVALLLLAGIVSVAVGGYWPARSYLKTGNPLWPAPVHIAGHEIFPGDYPLHAESERKAFPITKLWLQSGVGKDREKWPSTLREHSNWNGGIGFLWILGCVPAAVVLIAWSVADHLRALFLRGRRTLPFASHLPLQLLMAIGFFVLVASASKIRYSLWIFGIGLPCFALMLQYAFQMGRYLATPWKWLPRLWAAACIGILLFEGFYCLTWWSTRSYAWAYSNKWPRFSENPIRAARSIVWHDPIGYIFPEISTTIFDRVLSGSEPVAIGEIRTGGSSVLMLGQLCLPTGARPVHLLDHDTANNPEALADYVKSRRIRFVVWDWRIPVPKTLDALAVSDTGVPTLFRVLEFDPVLLQRPSADATAPPTAAP